MKIAGFQRTTLVDFPGRVASTIFLDRCNFCCGFCHNKNLVTDIHPETFIDESEVFQMLEQRKHLVDAVVITGGEPCLNSGLLDLVSELKKRGFLVKLDTNGSLPVILKRLFDKRLLDFVAMDIKSSLNQECYDKAAGINVNLSRIKESIALIMDSGVDHEFRTTVVPGIVEEKDILNIAEFLKGASRFALQQFTKGDLLDESFNDLKPYTPEKVKGFKKLLSEYFDEIEIRGL